MSDNPFPPGIKPINGFGINAEEAAKQQADFFAKVYGWMAAGLALTGGIALLASTSQTVQELVIGNRLVFIGFILAQLVLVGFLSARVFDWSRGQAQAAFIAYAALNGITLSVIFLVYTTDSIASTFFTSALMFGVMSAYGYFTKSDLSGWGKLLSMALIGLVIAMVVNFFLNNTVLSLVTSLIGVVLFTALTAYDTQKLKDLALVLPDEETSDKASILGALTLYLDFINLFLFVLRLFGNRR